jgi:hypothetical protein
MKAYSYPGWYQNLEISEISYLGQRQLLAADCLLAQSTGGPLTRKPPLKPAESAAIYDPKPTLGI